MTEEEVQIGNRLGLHARAAAKFVHVASAFQAKITVSKDSTRVDGKSILGLLTLAAGRGSKLRVAAEGEEAPAAVRALVDLVRGRFGEDD